MTITLEMPQTSERQLQKEWNGELPRMILESVAAEGYRQGKLSRGAVSEMLGLCWHDTEAFLKEKNVVPPETVEDYVRSRDELKKLLNIRASFQTQAP